MTQKAHINPVLLLISTVIVLVLVAVIVRPVNAGRGIVLRPPFNGTYRVTAYFDHDRPNYGIDDDGYIWIYNGERVLSSLTYHTGEPYPYDGHDGWDFSMGTGTDVLAAASGTVVVSTLDWGGANSCYGHTIVIDHGNNYYTQYSHLSDLLVNQGAPVVGGQHIANSGNSTGPTCSPIGAHLHFSVRQGGYANTTYAIDPFGWRGNQRDPLYNYNGKESSCLWAGGPGANVSCADFIVEDDGAGWSQNGAWYQSDAGNGFRQHWTYSWNPANYWAKWTPTLPQWGYYQIQAFIPCINATTTNARYEIREPWGTTIKSINQYEISDNWASLGTFFLDPATAYAQLYDYTSEPNYSKQVAADSIKFSASIVHLPYVRNNQNGWASSIIVRNNGNSLARGTINYYSQSGGRVSYDPFITAINGAIPLTPPSGFDGAAVVTVDQDVSVVVREENATKQELNEYNGIFAAGGSPGWEQTGTTVYVPIVKKALGGRTSRLFVMNAGVKATTAYLRYYDSSGNAYGSQLSLSLALNGSNYFEPATCALCSAVIWTTDGQPLVVAVREQEDVSTNNRSTYNAFNAGATSNFVPLVKKNAGGQSSGISVQNLGSQPTTISLICYPVTGNSIACGTRTNVAPKATVIFTLNGADGVNLPNGFVGSAVVNATSGQPIATLIHETGSPYKLATNALLNGTTQAYAPEIYGDYAQNGQTWNAGISVQNTSSNTNANITVTYYYSDGTSAGTWQTTLGPNRLWVLNRGSGNMPGPNFAGSAVITADQPLAVVVNVNHTGSGDTKASYTAANR